VIVEAKAMTVPLGNTPVGLSQKEEISVLRYDRISDAFCDGGRAARQDALFALAPRLAPSPFIPALSLRLMFRHADFFIPPSHLTVWKSPTKRSYVALFGESVRDQTDARVT